jgi:hypothetical protein
MPAARTTDHATKKGKGGSSLASSGKRKDSPPGHPDEGTELTPDSEAANIAMRRVEEIYGTNHFLTKNAQREFLRIRPLEAANTTVPFHKQHRVHGQKQRRTETQLLTHSARVHQAEIAHREAAAHLADLTATTDRLTDKIHTITLQKDQLVENYSPDDATQKAHTNTAGLAELMSFLEKANDTEDPLIMAWIRKEVVELTRQIHMGTQISDSTDLAGWDDIVTYGPSFFSGAHGPSKEAKAITQALADEAHTQHKQAAQELTEAQTNSLCAKQAFVLATNLATHTHQTTSLCSKPNILQPKQQQKQTRLNYGPLTKKHRPFNGCILSITPKDKDHTADRDHAFRLTRSVHTTPLSPHTPLCFLIRQRQTPPGTSPLTHFPPLHTMHHHIVAFTLHACVSCTQPNVPYPPSQHGPSLVSLSRSTRISDRNTYYLCKSGITSQEVKDRLCPIDPAHHSALAMGKGDTPSPSDRVTPWRQRPILHGAMPEHPFHPHHPFYNRLCRQCNASWHAAGLVVCMPCGKKKYEAEN